MTYTGTFGIFLEKTAFKLILKLWVTRFPRIHIKWKEKNKGLNLEELQDIISLRKQRSSRQTGRRRIRGNQSWKSREELFSRKSPSVSCPLEQWFSTWWVGGWVGVLRKSFIIWEHFRWSQLGRELLASSGKGPGMLLDILQYEGKALTAG